MILIEFYAFLYLYFMLVTSFILTVFTDPGRVPDDPLWDINIPENITEELQLELFALALAKREETLVNNRNILTEENLNDTRTTASKLLKNKIQLLHRQVQTDKFIT